MVECESLRSRDVQWHDMFEGVKKVPSTTSGLRTMLFLNLLIYSIFLCQALNELVKLLCIKKLYFYFLSRLIFSNLMQGKRESAFPNEPACKCQNSKIVQENSGDTNCFLCEIKGKVSNSHEIFHIYIKF